MYERIADELRGEIHSGAADGVLPTEAELSGRFGVSRSTIRKALLVLRRDGLVVSRQGSGWRVVPVLPAVRLGVGSIEDVSGAVELRVVGADPVIPPVDVARLLEREPGVALWCVERESVVGGTAVHRSTTWFVPRVGAHLDRDRAWAEPPARMVSRQGFPIGSFDQYVEAILSDGRDEKRLGVPPGSAMLQVTRLAFDPAGVPLFVSLHRHPGSSARVDLSLPTTDEPRGRIVTLSTVGNSEGSSVQVDGRG